MTQRDKTGERSAALRRVLVPLALAQFICSFAGSNMNVMINDISSDLNTTVQGVQIAITLLLVMAALMILWRQALRQVRPQAMFHRRPRRVRDRCPGQRRLSELGCPHPRQLDPRACRHGAADPAGLHTATLLFTEVSSRARAFGAISALGGIGVARPADRWPHHRSDQLAGRVRLPSPGRRGDRSPEPADQRSATSRPDASLRRPRRDPVGDRLVLLVMGILAADDNGWLMISLIVAGTLVLVWFFLSVRAKERAGEEPLPDEPVPQPDVQPRPDHPEHQWLLLLGGPSWSPAYLQVVRGYNAIETGVIFTAATLGLLASSFGAERPAKARAANPHHCRLPRHRRRHRRAALHGKRFAERVGIRAGTPPYRIRAGRNASPHRSTWCSPASAKRGRARYPAYPAACPTRLYPRHGHRRHHPRRRPHFVA